MNRFTTKRGNTFQESKGLDQVNICRHAVTILKNRTKEERQDLKRLMIQEAACDLESKQILWVKVKREFEPLYELLDGLRPGEDHRYWIVPKFSLTLELKIREQ